MTYKFAYLAGLLALTGCNSLPEMPDDNPGDIIKLADVVECEILTTFAANERAGLKSFKGWAATYTILQNAADTNGAGLDALKWIAPSGVDRLIYNADASISREAYRWGRAEFTVKVDDKTSTACARKNSYADIRISPSDFRLREWIDQISRSENQLKSLGYTVKVTVISGASLGGDFADKKWVGLAGLSHGRQSVRSVEFTFAEVPKPSPPLRVVVVAPIPERGPKPQSDNLPVRPRSLSTRPPSSAPSRSFSSEPVPDSAVQQNRNIQTLDSLKQLQYE